MGSLGNNFIIDLDIKSNEKIGVLKELIKKLYDESYISDEDKFLEDVLEREKLGVTGMGNYIAIPHGKSNTVNKAGFAVGVLKNEIEWEALDDNGVKIVILLCVPGDTEGANEHLKMLANITRKLAREEVINSLLKADTKEKVVESFNL